VSSSEPTLIHGEEAEMGKEGSLSIGQRIYRALFKVYGPADIGPSEPPAPHNPNDKTVPPGYHLETLVDDQGIRNRIAVHDEPEE
jgi:hypothetical protein